MKPKNKNLKTVSNLSISQAQLEAQKATQDFQRATEVLQAAKETISLAEQRLLEEDSRQFDSAWQEMLNHATQRVRRGEKWESLLQKLNIILGLFASFLSTGKITLKLN